MGRRKLIFGETRHNRAGVTLIELVVAMGILTILVSGILPLSVMTHKRTKEIELRQNLRLIRNAIDDYKKWWTTDASPWK